MDLTPEERALIDAYTTPESVALQHWGFHLAILLPEAVLAAYGLVQRDMEAIATGFFCLFSVQLWLMVASRRTDATLRSLCRKLLREVPGEQARPEVGDATQRPTGR